MTQLALPYLRELTPVKEQTTGTFLDNMRLPVHRWFRYSAGFSAQWVESVLAKHCSNGESVVLDPFAGSGTTLLAADALGIRSIGLEAHPFVYRICEAKLSWYLPPDELRRFAYGVLDTATKLDEVVPKYPKIIHQCFDQTRLIALDQLRRAWIANNDESPNAVLTWLAITSILRSTSFAGTAQWQYILPNKSKKVVADPHTAFQAKVESMVHDMVLMQARQTRGQAKILPGDARSFPDVADRSIDLVVTSPPYANNYDYADATRLEMSFWGEVGSWGDLHHAVRRFLIRSSSQHVSKDRTDYLDLIDDPILASIRDELFSVVTSLAEVRHTHGGKKHYHAMIAAYFSDMARVLAELRRVCKPGARLCLVIGDSAPYGVYVPVDEWLGKIAIDQGFDSYEFEKLRDRNVKWKNRTHTVRLHEGRLWLQA